MGWPGTFTSSFLTRTCGNITGIILRSASVQHVCCGNQYLRAGAGRSVLFGPFLNPHLL